MYIFWSTVFPCMSSSYSCECSVSNPFATSRYSDSNKKIQRSYLWLTEFSRSLVWPTNCNFWRSRPRSWRSYIPRASVVRSSFRMDQNDQTCDEIGNKMVYSLWSSGCFSVSGCSNRSYKAQREVPLKNDGKNPRSFWHPQHWHFP